MKNPEFDIAGRMIGLDHAPLVIAEIGINHNGDLDVAKAMVDSAKRAGAEMVKHQTHIIDDEMSGAAKSVIPGNTDKSIFTVMSECALNEDDERELKRYTEELGLIFLSTPFSRAAVYRLESMDVPAYKIGSGECNNYPLLEFIAEKKKPIILSTGMNDLSSVRKSVAILEKCQVPFALLHCTNIYPTPPELVRLGALTELRNAFPSAVVGLSDHSVTNYPCLGAVALGASILERHFTDSMERDGPDICCSMDPTALSELIAGSHIIAKSRGGKKDVVSEEQPTIDFAFSSIVTIAEIKKGDEFTQDNIWVKRPGVGGILAEHYTAVLGKTANRDISRDSQIQLNDVGELTI